MRTRVAIVGLAALALVIAAIALAVRDGAEPEGRPEKASSPQITTTQSTTSSTTLSAETAGRQLARTDRLEREQPLSQWLPHDTPRYKIDYHVAADGSLDLTITLYAILNNERQLPQYEAQLRQYKAEALEFIRSHGGDPAALRTEYKPPEAARL